MVWSIQRISGLQYLGCLPCEITQLLLANRQGITRAYSQSLPCKLVFEMRLEISLCNEYSICASCPQWHSYLKKLSGGPLLSQIPRARSFGSGTPMYEIGGWELTFALSYYTIYLSVVHHPGSLQSGLTLPQICSCFVWRLCELLQCNLAIRSLHSFSPFGQFTYFWLYTCMTIGREHQHCVKDGDRQ